VTPTPTRTETLLSIENVSLSYGANTVLRDVNVSIQDLVRPGYVTGQIVAFLGLSGSGKTSLLRIIAGLQKPTTGQVYLGANRQPTKAGDVGVVSQQYFLYRNRTVLGNLTVAALQAKTHPNRKSAMDAARALLSEFGLTDKANLYPCQLSGGQRQRVAIAQQILSSDHFLLVDEPTSGLDPVAKDRVCHLIGQVANRDELNTVIMVTHDVPSAVAVADTIWMLGRVKDRPGNQIVAVYDMIARGLAFHPGVQRMPLFAETVAEIQEEFSRL